MGRRQRRRQRDTDVRKQPNEDVGSFQARVFDALTDMDEVIDALIQ